MNKGFGEIERKYQAKSLFGKHSLLVSSSSDTGKPRQTQLLEQSPCIICIISKQCNKN